MILSKACLAGAGTPSDLFNVASKEQRALYHHEIHFKKSDRAQTVERSRASRRAPKHEACEASERLAAAAWATARQRQASALYRETPRTQRKAKQSPKIPKSALPYEGALYKLSTGLRKKTSNPARNINKK